MYDKHDADKLQAVTDIITSIKSLFLRIKTLNIIILLFDKVYINVVVLIYDFRI